MGTVFLSQTLGISRSPVCGNGVCEIGERPLRDSTGGSSTACERDCGHPYVPCPIARGIEGGKRPHLRIEGFPRLPAHRASHSVLAAEMTCGGRGVCFTASGQCGCYLGHRGGACEECIPGWVMTSRGCMFQSQTFGTQSGGTLTASLSSILIAVGVGAGVSFFMIVGFTLLTRRGLR